MSLHIPLVFSQVGLSLESWFNLTGSLLISMDSIRLYLKKGQVSHVNYILLIKTQGRNGWSFLRQNQSFESWFEEWSPNSQIQLAMTQLFNLAKIICVWLLWCFFLVFPDNWELISKTWSWTVNWSTTPCPNIVSHTYYTVWSPNQLQL